MSFVHFCGNTSFAEAPLQVGFAEADITPKLDGKPVYIAGFGQDRKATGVHDPLKARAVVLQDGKDKIAIVSIDVVGFFYPNVVQVRQQLPGFVHVLVSSTHNHEGPDTLGLWGPKPFTSGIDPDYLQLVEKQAVRAVQDAAKALKPATVRIGTAKGPELLHDNREPYIKHDDLTALQFLDPDTKKPVGLVVTWNCHPETLASKNTLISADYVGYTVDELHKKYRCPVVYLTGTVGGLMTSLKVPIKDDAGKELADGTFEKTERYGRLVGQLAIRAIEAAKPVRLTPFAVKTREIFLPMDNKGFLVARQIGLLNREGFLWTGDPYKAEPADAKEVKKPLCVRTEVGWLRLGQLDIAAIPGEIYPELVLGKVQDPADPGADFPDAPAEPGIFDQLPGPYKMLVGLANDELGYFIPKRQWDEKKPFCYGRQRTQYGEINSLGPQTAPIICRAFQELVKGKPKN